MSEMLTSILDSLLQMLLWLVVFFVAFGVLERFMPCNPGQRHISKNLLTDTIYTLVVPILNRFMSIAYVSLGILVFFHGQSVDVASNYLSHGFGPASLLPIWAQAAIVFIGADIMLYWTHRLFHRREMWRFHAIHHSSTPVSWHSTYRFHPVNIWLSFTLVDMVMLFLGFSPESVSVMATFNLIYSAMVHANLNWTFGPFKYLFASPVFHRWHHTSQIEGMDKNFAPTFPLLDIVFGTFYMPEGRLPESYGVPGSDIPEGFWGQMAWPFRQGNKQ